MSSKCNIVGECVKFINIKDFTIDLRAPGKISVEYIVKNGAVISNRDWVAIYPRDCDIQNLELLVTYEFVLIHPINKDEMRFEMHFNLKGFREIMCGQQYQFVYISRFSEIYGVSDVFTFCESITEMMFKEPQSLYNNDNDNTAEYKTNNKTRSKKYRRKCQNSVKVHLEMDESEDKGASGDHHEQDGADFINRFIENKKGLANAIQRMEMSSPSFSITSTPPQVSCSNCRRVGTLLKIQDELYTTVKNLAEENAEQKNILADLKKQLELKQAAYQKLSVTLMQDRLKAKVYSQNTIYEETVSENRYTVVEPPTQDKPRYFASNRYTAGEKMKNEFSVLKLKAIIGNQEQKIRFLTEKIAELQKGKVKKVSVIVKEIEELAKREES